MYGQAGTYNAKLTVTDDKGATGSIIKEVTVAAAPPSNKAPVAAFTSTVDGMTATFNGSGSDDSDGSIASWSWDFGDTTAAGTGANPQHTYGAAGTYQVTLTVTDNQGATNSIQKPVIAPGPNQVPTAALHLHLHATDATFTDGQQGSGRQHRVLRLGLRGRPDRHRRQPDAYLRRRRDLRREADRHRRRRGTDHSLEGRHGERAAPAPANLAHGDRSEDKGRSAGDTQVVWSDEHVGRGTPHRHYVRDDQHAERRAAGR